jgi:predicted amidohydrolase YtcJ
MITTGQAVMSLRPNTEWSMNGDDVEGIIWHTPNVEPLTTEEVQEEMQRLEQETENAEAERIAAKESAMQKLAALGLTEAEVHAILGGI